MFSPCSRTAIASVLKYKSSCFLERSTSFCGNGIIEEDEECDPGPDNRSDACCTEQCNFTAGSVCSDHNSDCCADCQFAGTTRVCYSNDGNTLDSINGCIAEKRCSSNSAVCDVITHKPSNSSCFDEGKCDATGECLDFCQAKGEELCRGEGNETCYWMCVNAENGTCSNKYSMLPNGKPCPNGVCIDGMCLVEPQTQVKIWRVLTGLTPSIFWDWMKSNVILVVILVTSVFWVPLSIFVNWLDKGQDEVDWYNTMTLQHQHQRKKDILRTQKSTVSSRSFELMTKVNMEPCPDDNNVFTLTNTKF
ncbi:ADAM 17-like protease [Bolinopsis microptera]|uniref:ADAM 17-like protease n=1 Tax=Bolinopsis microptera TaxID=2820187 RepID=UPI003079C274